MGVEIQVYDYYGLRLGKPSPGQKLDDLRRFTSRKTKQVRMLLYYIPVIFLAQIQASHAGEIQHDGKKSGEWPDLSCENLWPDPFANVH